MLHVNERLRAAVKYGLIIRPSGRMKWIASVTVLAAYPSQMKDMNLFPLDADSEMEAARVAAQKVANVLFRIDPIVSTVTETEPPNLFTAVIGDFDRGVTRGVSLSILIRKYYGK